MSTIMVVIAWVYRVYVDMSRVIDLFTHTSTAYTISATTITRPLSIITHFLHVEQDVEVEEKAELE